MKNPWTSKNPFMSMWLSGANSAANRARVQLTAAGRRQVAANVARGVGDVLDFWTGTARPATAKGASAGKTGKTNKPRRSR